MTITTAELHASLRPGGRPGRGAPRHGLRRDVRLDAVAPVLPPVPVARIVVAAVVLDFLLVAASFVTAQLLRDGFLARHEMGRVVAAGALGGVLAAAVFALGGLYDPALLARGWRQLSRLVRSWLVVAPLSMLAIYIAKPDDPLRSRLALALFLGLGLGAGSLLRLGFWRTLATTRWGRALRGARVIVGTGSLARRLAAAAADEGRWEPRLIGFVDEEAPARYSDSSLPAPFLGDLAAVRELARRQRVSDVLVAREDLTRGHLVELAHAWMEDGLHVSLASSAFEVMVARASTRVLGDVPLAEFRPSAQHGPGTVAKRAFDILSVTLGGLVLLPIFAIVAIAVKLSSPGPVLYRQERIGRGGRPFTMLKFRSMVAGNDDGRHREYVRDLLRGAGDRKDAQGRTVFKLVDDPRITPLGRLLRRSSLDELPQLWNVLRGDMSLVGPRPCLRYEWDLYQDWQRRRLDAIPGITGLWQVAGRSRVSFEDMVLLDLHYIANWSWAGDLALLARTVPVVLDGRGGH